MKFGPVSLILCICKCFAWLCSTCNKSIFEILEAVFYMVRPYQRIDAHGHIRAELLYATSHLIKSAIGLTVKNANCFVKV